MAIFSIKVYMAKMAKIVKTPHKITLKILNILVFFIKINYTTNDV